MIILSNALSQKTDEGALNVTTSLVKRIVSADPDTMVISYDRENALSDLHLKLNKFLLNRRLISEIRRRKETVLYIPFPARVSATALRVFLLSLFSRRKLAVLLIMKCRCNRIGRFLFRLSGAEVIALSEDSAKLYEETFGVRFVKYLKTGVDTQRFAPVSLEKSRELKIKYGFHPDCPLVLHVGHMKQGRNIAELLKLDEHFQILLVTSTLFCSDQDAELRNRLLSAPNIRLVEDYVPNIEEFYQMSDVYFFPVVEEGNCIDVPLSCLEAAACNKPIVTTHYGEMRAFEGREGFFFLQSFEQASLNQTVCMALNARNVCTRSAVEAYDWSYALSALTNLS